MKKTFKRSTLGALLAIALLVQMCFALTSSAITPPEEPGTPASEFVLASVPENTAVDIFVDQNDLPGIIHAGENLAGDIQMVTGLTPAFKKDASTLSGPAIIAGSIGKSPIIDALIAANKLDVSQIVGKWEVYTMAVIENPAPNVPKALVIAGSDKRGTVYGIYKISEMIGVSPFTFFSDSVPEHMDIISVPTTTFVSKVPSVKYRGIFINDERSLSNWLKEYKPGGDASDAVLQTVGNSSSPGFNHYFYTKVFDMILRGYGNYMWPAMWNNAFWIDDPLNPYYADLYGVVMGTSHQEFLSCPDKEWVWWQGPNGDGNKGSWDWIANSANMLAFWQSKLPSRINYENVYTIGIRGLNDTAILPSGTDAENIAMLNSVMAQQRTLLGMDENTDPKNPPKPTTIVLYKEVEAFYYKGWNAVMPKDVTITLCDDNHGNLRTLPSQEMRDERYAYGGFGMYYHFDYNGAPRSYRWGDVTPLEKIREQMTMAYDYGIDRLWIANVGDIKFKEASIEYWFKLGYDIETYGALNGPDKSRLETATREFGSEVAEDVADILFDFTQINNIRKPEIMFPHDFSSTYFDESVNLLARYEGVLAKARAIQSKISPERKDAYYNQVLHPVAIACNALRLAVNVKRSQLYGAASGGALAIANDYGQIARDALQFDNDSMYYLYGAPGLKDDPYYTVANGKYYGFYPHLDKTTRSLVKDDSIFYLGLSTWNHRVASASSNQLVLSGSTWGPTNVTVPAAAGMVVLPQPFMGSMPAVKTGSTNLAHFTSYNNETRYIDVANSGSTPFTFTATPDAPWIVLSTNGGTVEKITRMYVNVDWSKVPEGAQSLGTITFAADTGATVTVNVTADVFDKAIFDTLPAKTFIETDGYISMLSTDYTSSVAAPGGQKWTQLPKYGRELSAMKVQPSMPNTSGANGLVPGENSPYLEYNVYISTPGQIDIVTQWAPTNGVDYKNITTMNYGVSLGDETPQTVRTLERNYLITNGGGISWADGAENAVRTVTTRNDVCRSVHTVTQPGLYKLRIYMVNDGLTLHKILVGTSKLTARSNISALNNAKDTVTGATFTRAAVNSAVPTLFLGSRDGSSSGNRAVTYFGPPETYYVGKAVEPPIVNDISIDSRVKKIVAGSTANIPVFSNTADTIAVTAPDAARSTFAVVNGKAIVRIENAVAGQYVFEAFVGEEHAGTTFLSCAAVPTNVWTPQGYFVRKDGTVIVNFTENISGIIVTNNGDAVIKDDKRTVLIASPINLEAPTILVSGVKFPNLFPGYKFSFTVNVTEKTATLQDNIALSVPVRAATQESANVATNAVDGSTTTRWAASSGSYPNYIEIDLGDVYPLEQISVQWYESTSSPRAYRYEIWAKSATITDWGTVPGVSTDFAASGYTKVVDQTASTVLGKTTDSLTGVSARYIVVNCTGTSTGSGSPSLYEIQVKGWK